MPVKLFASAVIAALLLTGAAIPVSLSSGQGAQLQPRVTEAPAPETTLTEEEALAIALEHAELTQDRISRLEREFDRDRGQPHWDIEFTSDGYEYSYEIHVETGTILEWDRERED